VNLRRNRPQSDIDTTLTATVTPGRGTGVTTPTRLTASGRKRLVKTGSTASRSERHGADTATDRPNSGERNGRHPDTATTASHFRLVSAATHTGGKFVTRPSNNSVTTRSDLVRQLRQTTSSDTFVATIIHRIITVFRRTSTHSPLTYVCRVQLSQITSQLKTHSPAPDALVHAHLAGQSHEILAPARLGRSTRPRRQRR